MGKRMDQAEEPRLPLCPPSPQTLSRGLGGGGGGGGGGQEAGQGRTGASTKAGLGTVQYQPVPSAVPSA